MAGARAQPQPAAPLNGWLPDCVHTGGKFEAGLAFFADALGRITRFSREPADLAGARRLPGQAVLAGMVNAHSHAFHRALRGQAWRWAGPGHGTAQSWNNAHDLALQRMSAGDVFDTARMAFLEMLLGGITCVGEFDYFHHAPGGGPEEDPNASSREVLRAAHDVGIRISLLKVACASGGLRGGEGPSPPGVQPAPAESFVRECESLRTFVEANYPADEAWLGVAVQGLAAMPPDMLRAIGAHAHARRMRLHAHVSQSAAENAACVEAFGRTPVALLAGHGLIDKRFTAVGAARLSDEEIGLLGSARVSVCLCPPPIQETGEGLAEVGKLAASGAGIAMGSDGQDPIDLMAVARLFEHVPGARGWVRAGGEDPAATWWHAATVGGARSLGATTGALEVGRPADFFTVNLFDPAIAGATPETLPAHIVSGLGRRAIREVWVGARPIISGGRHAFQGQIVGRFVELQKRLWAGASA